MQSFFEFYSPALVPKNSSCTLMQLYHCDASLKVPHLHIQMG